MSTITKESTIQGGETITKIIIDTVQELASFLSVNMKISKEAGSSCILKIELDGKEENVRAVANALNAVVTVSQKIREVALAFQPELRIW